MKRVLRPRLSSSAAIGWVLALLAVGAGWADLAAAPRRIDHGKRSAAFSPKAEDNQIKPDTVPTERADVLQDKRFNSGDTLPRETALVGERRAPIELKESRDKEIFVTPDAPTYDRRPTEKNERLNGKMATISTTDTYERSRTAERFQEKIDAARPVVKESRASIAKQTTFDRVNRFVFRKNADQRPTVQRAGDEAAPRDLGDAGSVSESARPTSGTGATLSPGFPAGFRSGPVTISTDTGGAAP
jgi:hypothetical protein